MPIDKKGKRDVFFIQHLSPINHYLNSKTEL